MPEALEQAPRSIIHEEKLKSELKEVFTNEWFARTAIELKEYDRETYNHSLRVGVLASRIGTRLELPEDLMKKSGLSHDFGKLHVPLHILQKEGPLTDDERITMDTHADASFLMAQPHDNQVATVIVAHHEYQNHSYPRKTSRPKDTALEKSQLVLVLADRIDAWMSERPYKPAFSPEETRDMLMDAFAEIKQSGKVQNPEVLGAFDEELIDFAIQTRLNLDEK